VITQVPVFFETDPINTCGFQDFLRWYGDDIPYWESERQRNTLRRVHSAWNAYLKQFDNRFVTTADIAKEHIPISSLSQAVRLEFTADTPDYGSHKYLLDENLSKKWPLRILADPDTVFWRTLLKSGKAPHLKHITYMNTFTLMELGDLIPDLHFLELWNPLVDRGYDFSRLTTLIIVIESDEFILDCNFPSLMHLSLYLRHSQRMNAKVIVDLLRVLGKNLITYHDNFRLSDHSIPDEIRHLCPNLERIRTGLRWPSGLQFPTRLLTFSLIDSLSFDPAYMPAPDLRAAGIRIIRIEREWIEGLGHGTPTMDYVLYALEHDLTFKDVGGVTFQDFVVSILLYRKGGCTGEDPFKYSSIEYVLF
jgi:hypothetical protein